MLHFPSLDTFQHETLIIWIRRRRRLHFKSQHQKPGKRYKWEFGDKNKRADHNSGCLFHIQRNTKKQENHQEEQNKASGKERDFVIPMSHYNTKCYIIFLTDRNRAWPKIDSACSQRISVSCNLVIWIICFSHFEWRFLKVPTIIYMYAFSRCFYPKRRTVLSDYTCFVSMCVPWELNPQPFALLTQCNAPRGHCGSII